MKKQLKQTLLDSRHVIIGVTEENAVIMLDRFHSADNFSTNEFYPVYQDTIDERNDMENLIDNYGYLWDEMDESYKCNYESQEEYFEACLRDNDGLFMGHDTSYTNHLSYEFQKQHFPGAEGFECVGSGWNLRKMKFKTVLNQELLDLLITIEKKRARANSAAKKEQKRLEKFPKLTLVMGGN